MNVDRGCEAFFSALASGARLHIVELLCERSRNVRELSEALGLSASITARHVRQLEEAGILRSESVAGGRGLQKLCSLALDGVALTFEKRRPTAGTQVFHIGPGQYSAFDVAPTCGLLTSEGMLGYTDDPRYFADPRHDRAACVWVGHGYLEYIIPNYFDSLQQMRELCVEMEICAEAPGYAMNWPSDIYFSINGTSLGYFTSPGDFGDHVGLFSPHWYQEGANSQYGQHKRLAVNEEGSFMDGVKISQVSVGDLRLRSGQPIRLRIESPPKAQNPRGFTLFGKGFGNYDQDIVVTLTAEPMRPIVRPVE